MIFYNDYFEQTEEMIGVKLGHVPCKQKNKIKNKK